LQILAATTGLGDCRSVAVGNLAVNEPGVSIPHNGHAAASTGRNEVDRRAAGGILAASASQLFRKTMDRRDITFEAYFRWLGPRQAPYVAGEEFEGADHACRGVASRGCDASAYAR